MPDMRVFRAGFRRAGAELRVSVKGQDRIDHSFPVGFLLLPPAFLVEVVTGTAVGVDEVALGVKDLEMEVGSGGASAAAHDPQLFAFFHPIAYGFGCQGAGFEVAVPGDGAVVMDEVNGVPVADGVILGAVAVVVSVGFVDDITWGGGDDFHLVVGEGLPLVRPDEDIGAVVVIAGWEVVAAGTALVIGNIGLTIAGDGIVVHKVGDPVHAVIAVLFGLADGPGQLQNSFGALQGEFAFCPQCRHLHGEEFLQGGAFGRRDTFLDGEFIGAAALVVILGGK